jgi:hypothetical protein
MTDKIKYTFSGHETFYCRSLWLKKGYDFVSQGKDFNSNDAVVDLGVGKNMVGAIRYWMRAFGLLKDNELTEIAHFLFNNETGKDKYIEDLGTLWLLHYLLAKTQFASIYKLFFVNFHKERGNEFTREQLQLFLKRKNSETYYANLNTENTINKDVSVLLSNYKTPKQAKSNEDFSALLLPLNLIKEIDSHTYYFNAKGRSEFVPEILLYAIIDSKNEDKSIDFDRLMNFASIFCLSKTELIDTLLDLVKKYPEYLNFTDDGGIKQLLFIEEIDKNDVLENYYARQ